MYIKMSTKLGKNQRLIIKSYNVNHTDTYTCSSRTCSDMTWGKINVDTISSVLF